MKKIQEIKLLSQATGLSQKLIKKELRKYGQLCLGQSRLDGSRWFLSWSPSTGEARIDKVGAHWCTNCWRLQPGAVMRTITLAEKLWGLEEEEE